MHEQTQSRAASSRPILLRLVRAAGAIVLFLALSAAVIFPPGLFFLRNRPTSCTSSNTLFLASTLPTPQGFIANGLAWGDYDNDGWDDLFAAAYPGPKTSISRIYHNHSGTLAEILLGDIGLPEGLTASSGFFADYDNDGWQDLFVIETLWSSDTPLRPISRLRAFRNARGIFTEKTSALGLDPIRSESTEGTLTFGDFDRNGKLDIVVSFLGTTRYYFLQPTTDALRPPILFGTAGMRYIAGRGEVAKALAAEPELAAGIEKDFGREQSLTAGGRFLSRTTVAPGIILPPFNGRPVVVLAVLPGSIHILRNGGNAFSEAYVFAPEAEPANRVGTNGMDWPYLSRRFYQPIPIYLPGDNRMDLFVATDLGRNLLLENDGQFRFRDVTAERGMAVFGTGMGVALGDTRRTGSLDLVVTNFGRALRFQPDGDHFQIDPRESINRIGFGWGVAFTDADNDGWPDLYISNGWRRFTQEIGSVPYGGRESFLTASAPEDRFYRNRSGRFADRTNRDICADQSSTFPVAAADVNRDGAEDLVLGAVIPPADGRSVTLFLNRGTQNHFIQIQLRGTTSNRDGVGAVITVLAPDGTRQSQFVAIGESFYAQHSLTKTFGLGSRAGPVAVEIRWPSGVLQHLNGLGADTRHTITEPDS